LVFLQDDINKSDQQSAKKYWLPDFFQQHLADFSHLKWQIDRHGQKIFCVRVGELLKISQKIF
jgi:hypothetical protein